ncbi:hypothetical protein BJY00DRAFT_8294 [Aspergillus carlsbadensis]|nr:hypothetical protein BJY00DRAFT_8294 [Aspergillus carlsbadensis]
MEREKMRNKPRISITLHPRGKNSLGENRRRLHYAPTTGASWFLPRIPSHRRESSSTPISTSRIPYTPMHSPEKRAMTGDSGNARVGIRMLSFRFL